MSKPNLTSEATSSKKMLTRSERQAGKPVAPVPLQRTRILAALASARDTLSMSAMAYAAFPDYDFRTKQGAALAVCRTVRGLYDDKLLSGASYGYRITEAGKRMVAEQQRKEVHP